MKRIVTGVILPVPLFVALCLATPRIEAQQPAKAPRIGLLSIGADPARPVVWLPFLEELGRLGYVEGQSILIERKFGAGRLERLDELVADLVRLRPDLVVATGATENLAAKRALPATSIVMMLVGDPVGAGLVASLARPGGNVTGLSTMHPDLSGKRLELLKETVPKVSRVAVLSQPANPGHAGVLKETEAAARALGLHLRVLEARDPDGLSTAFAATTRERLQALAIVTDAFFFNQRRLIAELATKGSLPAIGAEREFVEAGLLMSYGASFADLSRRAAVYVDKILKGAKPGDLPVEQPMRFELVVNLKTAKALGLTIPQSVLFRADQVIK